VTGRHKSLSYLAFLAVGLAGGASSASASGDASGRCPTRELRLQVGAYGEAATQFMQTLTFTNTSSRTCALAGWPSVRVKDGPAVTIVRVVQGPLGARPFRRVLLRSRGAASFDIYGADWNVGADRPCPKASALLVTPPGNRAALRIRIRLPDCGRLYVAPLIPGRRDRLSWSRVWNA
jgi:uncharacterized protein DUF4232